MNIYNYKFSTRLGSARLSCALNRTLKYPPLGFSTNLPEYRVIMVPIVSLFLKWTEEKLK